MAALPHLCHAHPMRPQHVAPALPGPGWPKAHARQAEALSASGQHHAAASAFAMASLRASQQRARADAATWSAKEKEERLHAAAADAAARQRAFEAQTESAAAEFDAFFARALTLRVLSEEAFDMLTDHISNGQASEGALVLQWRPAVQVKEAQLNTGVFEALDGAVIEATLALLSAKDLARMEQTCRFFSGALDGAAKERLRRTTRCARLLALASRGDPQDASQVSDAFQDIGRHVSRYCSTSLDEPPGDALACLATACAPTLLAGRKTAALFCVCVGLPASSTEPFWRSYLSARAAWLEVELANWQRRTTEERIRLHAEHGLSARPTALRMGLRVARERRGVLSTGALITILNTITEEVCRRRPKPGPPPHTTAARSAEERACMLSGLWFVACVSSCASMAPRSSSALGSMSTRRRRRSTSGRQRSIRCASGRAPIWRPVARIEPTASCRPPLLLLLLGGSCCS